MQKYLIVLTGRTPLVVHNIRLANPLDPYAKRLKEISAKRKKTDEDHIELGEREWEGGLYYDNEVGPYVPATMPLAAFREAGAITRNKTDVKRALTIQATDGTNRIPIDYDGPKDLEDLRADPEYRDVRMVRVQQARTVRTRPRYPTWSLSMDAILDETILNPDQLEAIVRRAGMNIGIGEAAEGNRARFDVAVEFVEDVE